MKISSSLLPLCAALTFAIWARAATSLLPADPTPQFHLQGLAGENWSVIDVGGQPFSRVWRLTTPYNSAAGNPYDFFLTGHALQGITQGDLLLSTVWVRSISASFGQAYTRFVVQQDQEPYTKSAEWFLSAGREWKQFQIPFRATTTNDAGSYSIQFWISSGPQVIEVAGLQLVNYGPGTQVKDLGLSGYPYEGFKEKAWLREAEARIENLRKGDTVVVLRDGNGQPLPDAKVEIRMKSHQFGFGTAVDSKLLLGIEGDTEEYRAKLRENFNRATLENDLKWPQWISNPTLAIQGLDWLKANGFKQVRGHNLIWPGWQYLPAYLKGFAANPSGLEAELEKHIREETAATAGRLSEWDVLNEPVTNVALQNILSDAIQATWFKVARQADPDAKLYVNDYNVLEGGANDTPHQAGLEAVVGILNANGAGLQGIGLQAHFQWQLTEPSRLFDMMTRFAHDNQELQVTELDVDVEDPDLQAEYLADFLTISFSHPSLTGVTLWGFWEGQHFRPNAALWRQDWTMKSAAVVWRDLVYKKWWTQIQTRSNAAGVVRFRGFGGSYEAVVTENGNRHLLSFELAAGKTNYVSFGPARAPQVAANAVLNGASFLPGAISPGEIVAIFGTDLGDPELDQSEVGANPLPNQLGDVAVLVDGIPAQLLYSVQGQVGVVLPLTLRGLAQIQVAFRGLLSNDIYLPVADAAPGIFTQPGTGRGQTVLVNGISGELNSPDRPAVRGETITFFATGLGMLDSAGNPRVRPRVLIGEREAEVQYVGSPLPGVFALNARLPSDAQIGGAVLLTLRSGNFQSQAGATLVIR